MNVYKQEILNHYRHPRNFGELANKTHSAKGTNASCGDTIQIDLIIDNGKVKEVAFSGEGCAVAMASASMLTEKVKTLNLTKIKELNETYVIEYLGKLNPSRKKCALLPLKVLQEAIEGE
ncbi:iron-sulfur cluster assembly scaffold protein [Patescibacteria group bacterium]|nr:iron-sulfur cluster assembly scaffold protein [Patescibacteria group bacterium]